VWVLERWARLTRWWRTALVAGFTLVLAGASLAGYHQWHYMQHDNRFCTSCHLMVDPFQRFSRSAHAKLECHNCHEGRVPEQLHQIWLTAVEHPSKIGRHARVPNEVCAK
jgi:nitrate/TMAO reductase-like tetraheme cytochrome c subunit